MKMDREAISLVVMILWSSVEFRTLNHHPIRSEVAVLPSPFAPLEANIRSIVTLLTKVLQAYTNLTPTNPNPTLNSELRYRQLQTNERVAYSGIIRYIGPFTAR